MTPGDRKEEEDGRGFDFSDDDLAPKEPAPGAYGGVPSQPKSADRLAVGDDQYNVDKAIKGTDDDLAKMYVSGDRTKRRSDGLTINEGLPVQKKNFTPVIVAIVLLLIFGGLGAFALLGKMSLIDEEGVEGTVSPVEWLQAQFTMSAEQRDLQAMDERERGYLITKRRIYLVHDAAFEYFSTFGRRPANVSEIVREKLLSARDSVDGWLSPFVISVSDSQFEIRSGGTDLTPGNADDIVLYKDKLSKPAEFVNLEIESSGEF